jgi:adenylate kinase
MLNIVIFGPPGSGKGTQSKNILKKYNLIHLSTGDILRNAIEKKTPLGILAKKYMDKGELVPDKDVIQMVINKLDKNNDKNGFIFDGFPRTQNQAKFLKNLLKERNTKINVMVTLEVNYDELVKRLINRSKEMDRSDDKNVSIIENRINIYNKQTAPIIEFYKKENKYQPVDGTGTVDEIVERICKIIDKYT